MSQTDGVCDSCRVSESEFVSLQAANTALRAELAAAKAEVARLSTQVDRLIVHNDVLEKGTDGTVIIPSSLEILDAIQFLREHDRHREGTAVEWMLVIHRLVRIELAREKAKAAKGVRFREWVTIEWSGTKAAYLFGRPHRDEAIVVEQATRLIRTAAADWDALDATNHPSK